MSYNTCTTEQASTKCTPYKLLVGQDVLCPINIMYGSPPNVQEFPCTIEYVKWIKVAFESLYSCAPENHQKAAVKQDLLRHLS